MREENIVNWSLQIFLKSLWVISCSDSGNIFLK